MRKTLLELLKTEVKPAMGCTEPVAVTLAVAKARAMGGHINITNLEVEVSPNIYKNGLSVGIPKSDEVGIVIASAIGAVDGDPELGLKIYETIQESSIIKAKELIKSGVLKVGIADVEDKVYIGVKMSSIAGDTELIIQGMHHHFSYCSHNGEVLINNVIVLSHTKSELKTMSIEEILEEIEKTNFEEIEFLLEGLEMNAIISKEGQLNKLGLGVGYNTIKSIETGLLGDDLANKAMYYTAAASDARMSGISLPVMSSNGSGNNGLTAILPILAYKDQFKTNDEQLAKALAISHLLNCYIKSDIGRLSALCSCGISAATGAGAAITWLMGGTYKEIAGTIQNMIGNVSGMICDGAKDSCSLKLATAASMGVKSAIWSMQGTISHCNDGIVGRTAEESIKNLGVLSREGMQLTDLTILNIMKNMQS